MNYKKLLHQALIAAVEAGKEILSVYQTSFKVEYKEDQSPVTMADKKASTKITEELKEFNIHILSEEGNHETYEQRKNWRILWIIDPLDGTKEFIKRNGEFTVNIGLVEDGLPTIGVIYSPVSKDIYFAANGIGAFKIDGKIVSNLLDNIKEINFDELLNSSLKLPIFSHRDAYTVVASRSHMSSETYAHIESLKNKYSKVDIITTGSSIKMCWVAEGKADEYPRFGSTMEWDTAAGQAILQQANATLIDYETKTPMKYNKENFYNQWFIAKRLDS